MKLLPSTAKLVRALLVVGLVLQFAGCDMHVDKHQASYVKALTETKVLLVSMEAYKEKNKRLPASLSDLAGSDPALAQMNLAAYTYNSSGIPVADGGIWLVSVPDPKSDGQVIVGRLPIEVAIATPANKHLQPTPR